jgi:hypothetical protein
LLEGAERVEQRVTHGGRRRVEQVKLVDEDHHVLATEEGFAVGKRKPLTKAIWGYRFSKLLPNVRQNGGSSPKFTPSSRVHLCGVDGGQGSGERSSLGTW